MSNLSAPLAAAASFLRNFGYEVDERTDYDGEAYLSIPFGHNQAVEIELQDRQLVATARSWDVTGGVSDESELSSHGIGQPRILAYRVRNWLVEQAETDAQLDAQLAADEGEDR